MQLVIGMVRLERWCLECLQRSGEYVNAVSFKEYTHSFEKVVSLSIAKLLTFKYDNSVMILSSGWKTKSILFYVMQKREYLGIMVFQISGTELAMTFQ